MEYLRYNEHLGINSRADLFKTLSFGLLFKVCIEKLCKKVFLFCNLIKSFYLGRK